MPPPQSSRPKTVRTCPNCAASMSLTTRVCPVCKLEASKMDAFAAAKQAAQQKGLGKTKVEEYRAPLWKNSKVIGTLIVLSLIALAYYHFSGAGKPPAWTTFPTDKTVLVSQLFDDIAVGDDPGYDKAYAMVAPSLKDPSLNDEKGLYRQYYHEIFKYLRSEFGNDWVKTLTLEQDPLNSDLFIVHIGIETLHVGIAQVTPADKLKDNPPHYALAGIAEFDVRDAAAFQQSEAITGVLRGEAGEQAVKNIQAVLGSVGVHRRETPMQTKMRLLPDLHDPRNITKYEVYGMWPVRTDPVVRRRLDAIVADDRYGNDIKEVATEVINNSVTEEELIAAHVQE